MVSTRQGTKTRESAKELSSPADSGDEYEERTPEPTKTRGTKRARSSKATAKDKQEESRRKRAKLSMLPDMPIDILYDVGVSFPHWVFLDAKRLADIFSGPPSRPDADLLDFEDSQRVSDQQVVAARMAGVVPDDRGEREATTLSFRDYGDGICEPFVRSMLHGLWNCSQQGWPSI